MPTYQVIWNATTKTAGVQAQGATPPAGSLIAGTFEDANGPLVPNTSTVLYHAIRDALYSQGVLDMQRLVIVGGSIPPVGPSLPGVVRNFIAGTATETTQPLSWQAPATGTGPFTYKVSRRLGSSTGAYTQVGGTINNTSYTSTGLVADTAYDYSIVATNSAGDSTQAALINDAKTAVAAGADARPIFLLAPATLATVNTQSLIAAGTRMGTANSKTVASFPVQTTTGNYGWVLVPAAASGSGVTFRDLSNGGAPGDWNGAASTSGPYTGSTPVPVTSTVLIDVNGVSMRAFRMNFPNSQPTVANWSTE